MDPETSLIKYYAQRAPQYERVYHKPERQEDLRRLRAMVSTTFGGKNVLEVACGTGYWTELISVTARSVVALDINDEVLAIAREKPLGPGKVTFIRSDVYALPQFPRRFDAAMAGFWWSHVPKARLPGFLRGLHDALEAGATVMFFDNAYVEGSSTPISGKDSDGNPPARMAGTADMYQERVLDDGSVHRVIKNFPTAEELRAAVTGVATDIEVLFLRYYWVLKYRFGGGG